MDIFSNCPYCGKEHGNHRAGCPNAPAPDPVCKCEVCGGSIYPGETIIKIDEAAYHEQCLIDEYRTEA